MQIHNLTNFDMHIHSVCLIKESWIGEVSIAPTYELLNLLHKHLQVCRAFTSTCLKCYGHGHTQARLRITGLYLILMNICIVKDYMLIIACYGHVYNSYCKTVHLDSSSECIITVCITFFI